MGIIFQAEEATLRLEVEEDISCGLRWRVLDCAVYTGVPNGSQP